VIVILVNIKGHIIEGKAQNGGNAEGKDNVSSQSLFKVARYPRKVIVSRVARGIR
jgi:hypothetical protein